jgi:hypothetical protein
MYDVKFITYGGMVIPMESQVSYEEAKARVLRRIRYARKHLGIDPMKIARLEWEFPTPDDAGSISDNEGFLKMERVRR